ncbi:MAG: sulfotransferase family protein [Geminicoccaceae bacterium]
MTDRQPDFVIVGATKSATTWLQRNLQQHSAVFMPGTETHYFSRYFERGPAWYGAFFEPAAAHQIVGEKSNSYLDHAAAPRRLRDALPDVRLIVQLRDPIERAWAHYRAYFRRDEVGANVDRDLGDSLDAERLHAGGLYFRHLSRFLELFPREQLCVTLYDDLDREPAGVLNRVRAHIGLATTDVGGPAPVEGAIQPIGDSTRRSARRSASNRPARRPELSDALRARLRAYYEDDVRALSALLGRDLTAWLSPTRALP